MKRLALLSLLGNLALCGPAVSQPAARSFFIRGWAGFSTQALGDWNDDIDVINAGVPGSSGPKSLENFGGVIPWGFEAGYQLNPALALSIGVLRQRDLLENSYEIPSESLTMNSDLAMTAVTGAISFYPPNLRGVFLGADLGVGFGTARRDFLFQRGTTNIDRRGDWSGTGLVGGGFLGYQYPVAGALRVDGRIGYQLQNLGEFDGTLEDPSPFASDGSGPPLNLYGQPMETDFSGVQLLFGIGYSFGGK